MDILTGLIIFNIVMWGGIIVAAYLRKNKNKIQSSAAAKKIENTQKEILHLSSDKIGMFLKKNAEPSDRNLLEAREYLKKVQQMMSDSNWALNTQKAVFKARNTTGDTILAVRATVDLYTEDTLFHTMNTLRTDIKDDDFLEISQNIQNEAANAIGVFKAQLGSMFGSRRMPKLIGKFREYEIQITEDIQMAKNKYIRELAGVGEIVEPTSLLDEYIAAKDELPSDLKVYANQTMLNIQALTEYAEDKPTVEHKLESFKDKYLPIVIDAMKKYNSSYDEDMIEELRHTLKVITSASRNLYLAVTKTENESSSVDQTVMEQMLVREGLYDPFNDEEVR